MSGGRLLLADAARVCVPHGAESGFDPHAAHDHIDADNVYEYIHGPMLPRNAPGEWVSGELLCSLPGVMLAAFGCVSTLAQLHNNFYSVFGVEKSRRIGQVSCESKRLCLNLTDADMEALPEAACARVSHDRTAQVSYFTLSMLLMGC